MATCALALSKIIVVGDFLHKLYVFLRFTLTIMRRADMSSRKRRM